MTEDNVKTTSLRREQLKRIGYRIYEEFCRRIDDPENVVKGDGWLEESYEVRLDYVIDEVNEFEDSVVYEEENLQYEDRHSPLHEAGDVLAEIAMTLMKWEEKNG